MKCTILTSLDPVVNNQHPDPELHYKSLALGLILYFLILGFLSGYLLTNLFLEGLINKLQAENKPQAVNQLQAAGKLQSGSK